MVKRQTGKVVDSKISAGLKFEYMVPQYTMLSHFLFFRYKKKSKKNTSISLKVNEMIKLPSDGKIQNIFKFLKSNDSKALPVFWRSKVSIYKM